jgi:hypothetical protein
MTHGSKPVRNRKNLFVPQKYESRSARNWYTGNRAPPVPLPQVFLRHSQGHANNTRRVPVARCPEQHCFRGCPFDLSTRLKKQCFDSSNDPWYQRWMPFERVTLPIVLGAVQRGLAMQCPSIAAAHRGRCATLAYFLKSALLTCPQKQCCSPLVPYRSVCEKIPSLSQQPSRN